MNNEEHNNIFKNIAMDENNYQIWQKDCNYGPGLKKGNLFYHDKMYSVCLVGFMGHQHSKGHIVLKMHLTL